MRLRGLNRIVIAALRIFISRMCWVSLATQNHHLLSLHSTGVDMHVVVKDETFNNSNLKIE